MFHYIQKGKLFPKEPNIHANTPIAWRSTGMAPTASATGCRAGAFDQHSALAAVYDQRGTVIKAKNPDQGFFALRAFRVSFTSKE